MAAATTDPGGEGEVAWLVGSLRERDAALAMLEQQLAEPRDELGTGVLRDVLSDAFFPGVTTLQTRAKYFLFVPWMYQQLERRSSKKRAASRIREVEARLLAGFRDAPIADGVIGSRRWRVPQTPSSGIYWSGLYTWRIRRFSDASSRFHAYLDSGRRAHQQPVAEGAEGEREGLWHQDLPRAPDGFPADPTMALTADQATFLVNCVLSIQQFNGVRPLIKDLIGAQLSEPDVMFWDLDTVTKHHATLWKLALDAARLSAAMHGAMLVYNRLCADLKTGAEPARGVWNERLAVWQLSHHRDEWRDWDRTAFWSRIDTLPRGFHVRPHVRAFVNAWVELLAATDNLAAAASRGLNSPLGRFIAGRELRVKTRARARLHGGPALDTWDSSTGVGADPMTFRWHKARRILRDIQGGLDAN